MGIKGLNDLIRKYAVKAFITVPISEFAGKRIAIDGNNWMYTNMAIARKKVINRTDVSMVEIDMNDVRREWFLAAINFIVGWLAYNITPVFNFDGKHPPEKEDTKEKRKEARQAGKDKIDKLYELLKGDILARPANVIEELRKALKNYNFIQYEDFELFKMIIKRIGIPTFQATGDGEHLCSSFCVEGKVAAVFSIDTDNLVYACPLLITNFSEICSYDQYGNRVPHLDCVRVDYVLEGLKMTHDKFVDLCIMSGCDFNTNMPGYGGIKSYKLLQQYGNIDNLPANLNVECLKHVRCREMFEYKPSIELIVAVEKQEEDYDDYDENFVPNPEYQNNFDIDKSAIITARDCLQLVGITGQIERLILSYRNLIPSSDGYVLYLQLPSAYRYKSPAKVEKMTVQINKKTEGIRLKINKSITT